MSQKRYTSAEEFYREIFSALARPAYWLYSSTLDASLQFRNNRLGFIWILLSSVVFVVVHRSAISATSWSIRSRVLRTPVYGINHMEFL